MGENDIKKYVGRQIKKYRLEKKLTQEDLGLKVGVKHNTISSYESGVNEPDQNILFAIAKALDVSINNLFPSIYKPELKSVSAGLVRIPVVGRISCGNGSLAYQDIEGYEPTPREWLNGAEHFYLRAKGDSMIGARIHEGDLLLIRKQPDVESGEIAAVLINDTEEAVLKRVFKKDNLLILQSENPNYQPILSPPEKVTILGKLKMNVIKF